MVDLFFFLPVASSCSLLVVLNSTTLGSIQDSLQLNHLQCGDERLRKVQRMGEGLVPVCSAGCPKHAIQHSHMQRLFSAHGGATSKQNSFPLRSLEMEGNGKHTCCAAFFVRQATVFGFAQAAISACASGEQWQWALLLLAGFASHSLETCQKLMLFFCFCALHGKL